jgi:hypothetical protein
VVGAANAGAAAASGVNATAPTIPAAASALRMCLLLGAAAVVAGRECRPR